MIGICKFCNNEYRYFDSQQTGTFCSKECSHSYRVLLIMESGTAKKGTAMTYLKRFKEYKCEECGISEWQNKQISLQLDHIDGNKHNNVKENVRLLCPNCHSQTPTWGSKNAKGDAKKRMIEGSLKGNKISQQNNRSKLKTSELENLRDRLLNG